MPTIYKSIDASAPVLTGQVNALAAVLKACLVSGYGSKSAAGWTNPYTGTNQEVFKQGGSGVLKYWQVDDNGPGLGGAKEARIWGFETMSAYNTGTGQWPAAATAIAIRKSTTADATVRDWIVAADAKTCHAFLSTGDIAGAYYGFSFGDLYSYAPGDQWKGYLIARNLENSSATGNDYFGRFAALSMGTQNGFFGQRNYTGFGGFVNLGNAGGDGSMAYVASTVVAWQGNVTFPNAADALLHMTPMRIAGATPLAHLRGRYRGLYVGVHPASSFSDQDTFSGINEYAGKTFLIVKQVASSSAQFSYCIVETSTWDESA